MPFWLRNAPAMLQWTIDVSLSAGKWKFELVYLDDIVLPSRSAVEHINHVQHVQTPLCDTGATLKLKKCSFFSDKNDFFGQHIRPRRLQTASHRTDAIKGLQDPRNVTKLNFFQGQYNDCRRFPPIFAIVVARFKKRLQKKQPSSFVVNEKELNAMKRVQFWIFRRWWLYWTRSGV